MTLPLHAVHFPYGRALRISTNSPVVLQHAELLWGAYRQLEDACPVHIEVEITSRAGGSANPECILQGRRVLFRADSANWAVADLAQGAGRGTFSQSAFDDAAAWRYHFLEPLGYTLVAARHFTLLHAAAIATNGRAVLLCGDSGAGKTCLAYFASRKRWDFLSGDATALIRSAPTPRIVGRPHEIRFRETATALFPELLQFPAALRPNGKCDVEVDPAVLRIPAAVQAEVAMVVLLHRSNRAGAALHPLPREQCREHLARSICFGNAELRRQQLAALESLRDAACYRLEYSGLDAAEAALWETLPRTAWRAAG